MYICDANANLSTGNYCFQMDMDGMGHFSICQNACVTMSIYEMGIEFNMCDPDPTTPSILNADGCVESNMTM
jgi:hypothetical protein